MPTQQPLQLETEALHSVINRLIAEVSDLDTLCKHLPRLISVSANVARIQDALTDEVAEHHAAIIQALDEINSEAENDEF